LPNRNVQFGKKDVIALRFWSAQRIILLTSFLVAGQLHSLSAARGSQDFLRNACSRELSIAIRYHQEAPASGIHEARLYSLDRSNLASSYASKLPDLLQSLQIARETPLIFHPLSAHDGLDSGRSANLPIGILPVIGSSIATVVAFAVSRARYISRTVQPPRERSGLQTSRSTLTALLAGLTATILLWILEVSLRLALR
jgi:hypothetical protein